jgi:hypothetical protein
MAGALFCQHTETQDLPGLSKHHSLESHLHQMSVLALSQLKLDLDITKIRTRKHILDNTIILPWAKLNHGISNSKVNCMEHFAKSDVTLRNTPSQIRKNKTKEVNPQLLPTCIQTQIGIWIITNRHALCQFALFLQGTVLLCSKGS